MMKRFKTVWSDFYTFRVREKRRELRASSVKETSDIKITYNEGKELIPEAFCDADYAGDTDTRKSTTESVLTINGSPIAWTSRLQKPYHYPRENPNIMHWPRPRKT
jgi:hypothetical protein